uniref:Putative glycosyltransferase n=2 Tax=viral metagenome TaxID=1070528 RepID=A0A6M3J106_9ZZZZ
MKIFALPSHQSDDRTSGVDFARILQPMKHLNKYKGIETMLFNIRKETDWLWVAKNFDVIYFNYLNNPWGFAAMGAMARHFGVKIVMDVDDALWEIHDDNPAHAVYKKGSEPLKNFTLICNEVDYITCTNEYLKNVIMFNTKKTPDKIKVFPNYVDLKLYKYKPPFKDDGQINLTHFGSTTHFNDLVDFEFMKGVNRIMDEYPNVIFRTVGAFIPSFRAKWGGRYENTYGHQDIYQWIKTKFPDFMTESDILVCPLVDDVYNRCKSQIKWLEASSAKVPGVWQNMRQYSEVIDGTNGILAKKDTEWYKAIKYLIDNTQKRKEMGEKAYQDVKDNWQIQNHLDEYADFFYLLDKNKK